ncbi:MAG: BTAD domain-containing putative transcriptional regulator [Anaerolineales bacterium]
MNPSLQFLGGFHPNNGLNSRHQALLAYLALHHPNPVSRSEIAFKLWADSSEEQALTNLRKALYHIKQTFTDGDFIQADARMLQLNPALNIQLDIADFTSALDSAERARRANDAETEQTSLETASVCYRGDLLTNLYDEWIVPERDRLRDMFFIATDRLIALLEARQHYRDAITHAQRLLRMDNLHEEMYRTLIRLNALNDDRAAALNVYHACASVLSQELGVEPDSSTRELYERLLKNDSHALHVNTQVIPISHLLVAREQEWKTLLGEWKRASSGNLRVTLLSGEAGIGKTRLAEDLLHWASRQEIQTASAACYSAEGQTSFAPIISWLRSIPMQGLDTHWRNELARILPELRSRDVSPQPITQNWQRQVFFESMARALLAQNEPFLLLLDDIQWCDHDMLEWLRYFLRLDKKAKILILVTLRAEELPSNTELQLLLVDLRAEGQLTEMELNRLDEEQTAVLGSHLLGKNFSEADSLSLFRESEGVPLFVVELANSGIRTESAPGTEAGVGEKDARSSLQGMPPRLKAILEGRLTRLSSPARTVVESAGIIGREFDFDLLRKASELDESATIHALDELWHLRMVRERGGLYDFSHDKLREATLAGISPIRLRWLHQRTGEALELNQSGAEYARIADHFARAGLHAKAFDYYVRAANQAQQLFAFAEALEHLRNATLLETKHAMLANLHEQRGDVLKLLEQREDAFQAFTQAHGLSDEALQKARLNRKQSTLVGRFEIDVARQKYQTTLSELSRAQNKAGYWSEWIEAQLSWVEVGYWMQNAKEVNDLMEQIKEPIEQHGTLLQKVQYRFRLISSAFIRERYRMNQSHVALAQETIELAIELGNSHQISNAKRQFGMVAMCADQLDLAEAAYREAISLCKKNGDLNSMLIARVYLSLTHRRQRKPDEVLIDTQLLEEQLRQVSQHPVYLGVVDANRAWLAYFEGGLNQARQFAQSALEIWQALENPYPFHSLALFMIFAIAVQEENMEEAFACAHDMLAPPQWRLTPDVESALLAAMEVDPLNKKLALSRFRKTVEKAKAVGYL